MSTHKPHLVFEKEEFSMSEKRRTYFEYTLDFAMGRQRA